MITKKSRLTATLFRFFWYHPLHKHHLGTQNHNRNHRHQNICYTRHQCYCNRDHKIHPYTQQLVRHFLLHHKGRKSHHWCIARPICRQNTDYYCCPKPDCFQNNTVPSHTDTPDRQNHTPRYNTDPLSEGTIEYQPYDSVFGDNQ